MLGVTQGEPMYTFSFHLLSFTRVSLPWPVQQLTMVWRLIQQRTWAFASKSQPQRRAMETRLTELEFHWKTHAQLENAQPQAHSQSLLITFTTSSQISLWTNKPESLLSFFSQISLPSTIWMLSLSTSTLQATRPLTLLWSILQLLQSWQEPLRQYTRPQFWTSI